MSIKKAFVELHSFLEANKDKKVSTILDQVTELCSAKGAGGTATSVLRDNNGVVVGILDYYFKQWLPVAFVEFGAKASSASGYNTMCKLGNSLWTRQQREFKKAKDALLDQVAQGEIDPTDIQSRIDELEQQRQRVEPFPVPELAFNTMEDLQAALEKPEVLAKAAEAYAEEQAAAKAAEAEAKAAKAGQSEDGEVPFE